MLSPAVLSVVHVFPSLWCWVWLVLCVESVGLPSVMMWGDRGETVGVCQVMWFAMLKSVKDRVLRVDTPGQQVLPHVRYGMTCLLIRDVVGKCALLGWVGKWCSYLPRLTRCKRGCGIAVGIVTRPVLPRETLAFYGIATTLAKPGIWPIVNRCNDM
jgi:hypothetical protein